MNCVEPEEPRGKNTVLEEEYIDEYWSIYRQHIHTLLAWGYADSQQRVQAEHDETDIIPLQKLHSLLIIDKALELLKTEQRSERDYAYSYGYGYSNIALTVAKAAEETHPREAIEIYRKHVEGLINQRRRGSYQVACQYLLKARDLYENLGEQETWTKYITELRDKNRTLRALKEELANAGL